MSKRLLCLISLVLVSGIISTSQAADTIFFQELFEDDNFAARGWYDGTMLRSTTEHIIFYREPPHPAMAAEYLFPNPIEFTLVFTSSTVPIGSA